MGEGWDEGEQCNPLIPGSSLGQALTFSNKGLTGVGIRTLAFAGTGFSLSPQPSPWGS